MESLSLKEQIIMKDIRNIFREPNDSEKEVIETDKVFVIDADFQMVMKNTPDFRFEIPSLPEIVKPYKAYHKHYFAED